MIKNKVGRISVILKVALSLLIVAPIAIWAQDYSVLVDDGFFFKDYEFLKPPYRLEAKDFNVFVNGVQVSPKYTVWSKRQYKIEELPVLPDSINKYSGVESIDIILSNGLTIITNAKMYFYQNYDKEEVDNNIFNF